MRTRVVDVGEGAEVAQGVLRRGGGLGPRQEVVERGGVGVAGDHPHRGVGGGRVDLHLAGEDAARLLEHPLVVGEHAEGLEQRRPEHA